MCYGDLYAQSPCVDQFRNYVITILFTLLVCAPIANLLTIIWILIPIMM